jgi:large subunit ribosomal protein L24
MNIKKGDKVKILAGKDNGKTGKVLQVFTKENKASIEGINLLIKHMRPRRQGDKGQRIEFPAPMDVSKMMLICTKCGKPTRVGHKNVTSQDKKKKYRACKKCDQIID